MSGPLEVAGLALAVFPLIISLLEHYDEGFQAVATWRFYRLEFSTLVGQLNHENILFQQHIEGLVRSISDSEYDIRKMMSDPHCDEWGAPELATRLHRKMSKEGEFEAYRSSIQSIHDNLDKLAKRLERCRPPPVSLPPNCPPHTHFIRDGTTES